MLVFVQHGDIELEVEYQVSRVSRRLNTLGTDTTNIPSISEMSFGLVSLGRKKPRGGSTDIFFQRAGRRA
jgi:hypothetical protein